jgi:hypothetical protein
VDFLTKKQQVNNGEVQQYYVKNSHPAIVETEMVDLVQFEMRKRQKDNRYSSGAHPFSGKIICGCCNQIFGSKIWHSADEYRRMIWRCNGKYSGGDHEKMPHLTDDQIRAAFFSAFNKKLENKAEIFAAYDEVLKALTDNSALDAEAEALNNELAVVTGLAKRSVQENAVSSLNQDDYAKRYESVMQRYNMIIKRLADIESQKMVRTAKRAEITRLLKILVRSGDVVTEFDDELWYITVDAITVYTNRQIAVKFRDGVMIEVDSKEWKSA